MNTLSFIPRSKGATSAIGVPADSEFGGAGSTVGVEAWTIDTFEFIKVDLQSSVGSTIQDILDVKKCYLILHTVAKSERATRGAPVLWTIHVWKGPNSTMIDGGIIGRRAVTLSKSLTKHASVHDCTIVYEEIGQESDALLLVLGIENEVQEAASPDPAPVLEEESQEQKKHEEIVARAIRGPSFISIRSARAVSVSNNSTAGKSIPNPTSDGGSEGQSTWHVWKVRDFETKRVKDHKALAKDNGSGLVSLNCYVIVENHEEYGAQLFLWTGSMASATTRARARTEARAKAERFSDPRNPLEIQHVHVNSENPAFEELIWRMGGLVNKLSSDGDVDSRSPRASVGSGTVDGESTSSHDGASSQGDDILDSAEDSDKLSEGLPATEEQKAVRSTTVKDVPSNAAKSAFRAGLQAFTPSAKQVPKVPEVRPIRQTSQEKSQSTEAIEELEQVSPSPINNPTSKPTPQPTRKVEQGNSGKSWSGGYVKFQPTKVSSSLMRSRLISSAAKSKVAESKPPAPEAEQEPVSEVPPASDAPSTVKASAKTEPAEREEISQKPKGSGDETVDENVPEASQSKEPAPKEQPKPETIPSSGDVGELLAPVAEEKIEVSIAKGAKSHGVMKVYDNLVGSMYEGAGKAELDTWYVAGKKLVMAPSDSSLSTGHFFDEDSYMFLHTSKKSKKELKKRGGSKYIWTIYTWRGEKASMIVNGFVGSRAIELRNLLIENGSFRDCEFIRQSQGKESPEFLALFPENKITVTKGQHKFSGFNKLGEQKSKPSLYLQAVGMFTRVPLNTASLGIIEGSSFMLDAGNRVLVYAASHCRRVDRAVTEELARSRSQKDYRKRWGDPVIVDNNPDSETFKQFMSLLERYKEPEWNQVLRARELGPMLWVLDPSSGEFKAVEEEAGPSGELEVPASRQLPHSLLDSSQVMVLDCVSEVFVWKGKLSTRKQFDDTVAALDAKLLSATSAASPACPIRPKGLHQMVHFQTDRFESSYFVERFYGWPRATQKDKEAAKFEHEIQKFDKNLRRLRTPSMEVKQMADLTPARAEDGYKDHSHPFDVAHITEEPNISGALRVWRVDKKGDRHELKGAQRGLFRSDATYLALFTYKNSTVNIIHSWVGRDASRSERTAVTLKTQTLAVDLRQTGPEYHSHLRQNAETLFFSTLLEKAGVPLVVVDRPRASAGSGKTVRALKVALSPFGDTAHVTEEEFELVAADGIGEDCAYLFVEQTGPRVEFTAYCYQGTGSPASVSEVVRRVTAPAALGSLVEYMHRPAIAKSGEIPRVNLVQLGPIAREREFPRLGVNPKATAWHGSPVRPMRLFEISWHKREVGGIFVEQVGTHRVDGSNNGNIAQFCQADLRRNGAYLLDTGHSAPGRVYVWFGNSGLSDAARALAIEVGALYVSKVASKGRRVSSIRAFLSSQPSTSEDGKGTRHSSRASNGGSGIRGFGTQLSAQSSLGSPSEVGLEVVEFGQEPQLFRDCFAGWRKVDWPEIKDDVHEEDSRRPKAFYDPIIAEMTHKAGLSDEGRRKLDQRRRQNTLERFSEKTKKAMALPSIPRRRPGNPNRGADQSGFTLPRQLRTVKLKKAGNQGNFKAGFVRMMDRISSSLVSAGRRGSLHISANAPFKIHQASDDEVDATLEALNNGVINWCTYSYKSESELILKGKGSSGFDEFLKQVDDSAASFTLVRFAPEEIHTETVGERILFVQVIPDTLPPTRKAMIVSQKDAIREILAPYDTEYCVTSVAELSRTEALQICAAKGAS